MKIVITLEDSKYGKGVYDSSISIRNGSESDGGKTLAKAIVWVGDWYGGKWVNYVNKMSQLLSEKDVTKKKRKKA